jgi:hypothetical protein
VRQRPPLPPSPPRSGTTHLKRGSNIAQTETYWLDSLPQVAILRGTKSLKRTKGQRVRPCKRTSLSEMVACSSETTTTTQIATEAAATIHQMSAVAVSDDRRGASNPVPKPGPKRARKCTSYIRTTKKARCHAAPVRSGSGSSSWTAQYVSRGYSSQGLSALVEVAKHAASTNDDGLQCLSALSALLPR